MAPHTTTDTPCETGVVEALDFARRVVEVVGPEHVGTMTVAHTLVMFHTRNGLRAAEAVALLVEAGAEHRPSIPGSHGIEARFAGHDVIVFDTTGTEQVAP